MPRYTAIVTLLAIALYFIFATRVRSRLANLASSFRPPPAISISNAFSARMRNTLEWMPTFLMPLWLCAIYFSDITAAALGLLWIVGRVVYFVGYSKAVEKRLPGFFIQSTACAVRRCCCRRGHRHAIGARLKGAMRQSNCRRHCNGPSKRTGADRIGGGPIADAGMSVVPPKKEAPKRILWQARVGPRGELAAPKKSYMITIMWRLLALL
jgi:glutathione S-transferase